MVTEAHFTGDARRCRCGVVAPQRRIVQQRLKSIPIGHVSEYDCAACGATFAVSSVTGVLFSIFSATVLTAAGALVTLHPPGSAVGATESNRWFGIALLIVGLLAWIVPAARIAGRVRHPLVRVYGGGS